LNAVRRKPRDEWETELRSYGCYPAKGLSALQTAEWWRWPWGGYPFTVPVEADGTIETWAFQRILGDMAALAPDDWQF